MNKTQHHYCLDLKSLSEDKPRSLTIEFKNHDDIFRIIDLANEKNIFPEASDNTEFAIGLKLFSEIILRNRHHPLFTEIQPALRDMMNRLKRS
jgi:Domain of Unknown Function with PDB structure (DUF3861)